MRYLLVLSSCLWLASCSVPNYPIHVRQCAFNSDMNCQLANVLQGYVGSNQLFGSLGSRGFGQAGRDVYQRVGFHVHANRLAFQYVSPNGPLGDWTGFQNHDS